MVASHLSEAESPVIRSGSVRTIPKFNCAAAGLAMGTCFASQKIAVAPLEFQGYVVGPALGAVHKAVVERGHGSWGIYTKSTTGRSALSDARPATQGSTGGHRGSSSVSSVVKVLDAAEP